MMMTEREILLEYSKKLLHEQQEKFAESTESFYQQNIF